MLKIEEIKEIIKLIDESNIDEFSYEQDGSKIKLKKNIITKTVQEIPVQPQYIPTQPVQPIQTQASATEAPKEVEKVQDQNQYAQITSPMVGTFYSSPSPEKPAYVEVGSKVKQDSIVCIVEAMKLFNEIEAEVEGEIVEILVKNGELVEYGQPLFLVKPM